MKRSAVVRHAAIVTAFVAAGAMPARAQVGYVPSQSPYIDLEYHQDLTLLLGYFHAKRDPVGVAPQSAPMVGALYEWRAGGPVYLTAELDRIGSRRLVIDPTKSGAAREVGTRDNALYDVDLSVALALTGFRSWHGLQPMVKGGLGLVSDFKKADVGGFDYGTRFAFSWGAGVRWVPGGRWAVRADVNNRLYTITYPQSYYIPPTTGNGSPVLSTAQTRSQWTNNPAFTIGFSWQYSR